TQLVGSKKVAETAKRLGIRSKLEGVYSIGLGTESVTPLELARAYATFAYGGRRVDGAMVGNKPRVIEEVQEPDRERFNAPVEVDALTAMEAGVVNSILQKAVQLGTGKRANLGDRPVAGKTGTTENYGDAWFVGYTPQLVVAVWVGYPTTLRPMLTEFHGDPVAGGTYPALIWKSFMERALLYLGKEPEDFRLPPLDYTQARMVVERDGRVQLDNGFCRSRREIVYFEGFGPRGTANCKPNEVDVPRVVGQPLAAAMERLEQQPLTPAVVYKPAAPRQRVDIVLSQFPARGRLSSFDTVTLVLAKAVHGVVPNVEGLPLGRARRKLLRRKFQLEIARYTEGPPGEVVSQSPPPGVAAAPGMTITLVVARS
ncbi:MAG: PASTA domain-containing protein, partial [Gaiellaceae bacterium]